MLPEYLKVITRDGTTIPALLRIPDKTQSTAPGIGFCYFRSRHHGSRLGHLFECKSTVGKITTEHCSWCWGEKY